MNLFKDSFWQRFLTHTLVFILGVLLGGLGMHGIDTSKMEKQSTAPEIAKVVEEVSKVTKGTGAKVTITRTIAEGKREQTTDSSSSVGQSKNGFWRFLGPDRGANDTASGVQPLTADGVSVGGSRNWGVLERTWNWFINWLWFIKWMLGLSIVILVAMLFYPPTNALALSAFQWIFSVLPLVGAAVVKIISNLGLKKTTTAATQIIEGTDLFKNKIKEEPFVTTSDLTPVTGEDLVTKSTSLTTRIRNRVLAIVKEAHNEAQDKSTRSYVSSVQNGG